MKETSDHELLYLIVQSKYGGHWSPLKGHLQRNEAEQEAALRETKEETGIVISDLTFIMGEDKQPLREYVEYTLPRPTKRVPSGKKTTVYFAARYCGDVKNINIGDDACAYQWLHYENLVRLFPKEQPEMPALFGTWNTIIQGQMQNPNATARIV